MMTHIAPASSKNGTERLGHEPAWLVSGVTATAPDTKKLEDTTNHMLWAITKYDGVWAIKVPSLFRNFFSCLGPGHALLMANFFAIHMILIIGFGSMQSQFCLLCTKVLKLCILSCSAHLQIWPLWSEVRMQWHTQLFEQVKGNKILYRELIRPGSCRLPSWGLFRSRAARDEPHANALPPEEGRHHGPDMHARPMPNTADSYPETSSKTKVEQFAASIFA